MIRWLLGCESSHAFPTALANRLVDEGLIVLDEGVRASATYRNLRSPWRYCSWRRKWLTASLAVTESGLVAAAGRRRLIDVRFDDPRFLDLHTEVCSQGHLRIRQNAETLHPKATGTLEFCFHTQQAEAFLNVLQPDMMHH